MLRSASSGVRRWKGVTRVHRPRPRGSPGTGRDCTTGGSEVSTAGTNRSDNRSTEAKTIAHQWSITT
jgi:hypothetical protein